MKNLQDPQYNVPQWALDIAIEGLQELARRLESDAAAFAKVDSPECRDLAAERAKQAREARKGHEFYIHL